jgi:hypothetical protein
MALALFGEGCAAFTSSGPVGPLRSGNATQLAAAWAYAYGPATATIGGVTIKGNAEMQASSVGTPPLPSPLPLTIGIRQAVGDSVEVGADIGTMDSGFRLRVGLPDGSSLPCDLAFEARTGKIAAFSTGSYRAGLAFEAYPDITPAAAPETPSAEARAANAGAASESLQLGQGVVLRLTGQATLYVAGPRGGLDALDALDGRQRRHSSAASFPLFTRAGLLLAVGTRPAPGNGGSSPLDLPVSASSTTSRCGGPEAGARSQRLS